MIEVSEQHVAIAVPGVDSPHILTSGLEQTTWGRKTWFRQQA